jgi:ABC-type amino acid transport substrate-binding protein
LARLIRKIYEVDPLICAECASPMRIISIIEEQVRFEAIVGNRIDLLCGATTKTHSRGEVVDFTRLTFVTGASFMTLKGMGIRGNFEGRKIGVLEGTTTTLDAVTKLF